MKFLIGIIIWTIIGFVFIVCDFTGMFSKSKKIIKFEESLTKEEADIINRETTKYVLRNNITNEMAEESVEEGKILFEKHWLIIIILYSIAWPITIMINKKRREVISEFAKQKQ